MSQRCYCREFGFRIDLLEKTANAMSIGISNISIRMATESDAPGLAGLRYALRASTGRATEPQAEFLARCERWMTDHLKPESFWHCWVAEQEGHLIGAVWVQLVEKIPNPRDEPEYHAYLTNFFLEESVRQKGIGTSLLTMALDWCRNTEVHAVILWPTERSRTLYERHGFAVPGDLLELLMH
jgi:GNAT superfamily N-acetyltransferase